MVDELDKWHSLYFVHREIRPLTGGDLAEMKAQHWPAFVAMWGRIAKDLIVGFLWYQATGEKLNENDPDHFYAGDEFRDDARVYLADLGAELPPLCVVKERHEKNQNEELTTSKV